MTQTPTVQETENLRAGKMPVKNIRINAPSDYLNYQAIRDWTTDYRGL
jgi:hypothetical protein